MKELISELKSRNIHLSVEKDELVVDFDGNELPGELISKIKDNKFLLIEYLGKYGESFDYIEIPLVSENQNYEISSAQRRLWILSQFEEGSVAYNISNSTYLNQDIDIACFKRAIDSTIERHEILRTVFKEDESGEIRQWVLNRQDLGFKLDCRDFRKQENGEGRVKEYLAEDSHKAFDLEKGPLLRAGLLQVEDKRYAFYFNIHHIISDAWSFEVLSKDVFSYYEAYKENRDPVLNPLRIQYKDYSAWALDRLISGSFNAHRNYWLERLSGELPLLDLPCTKQRPKIKTYNGRTLSTCFSKASSQKLKEYSQEKGGTLFIGLLSSLKVLLHRYTGQTDIIVGSPVSGREHSDLEDQIGFYVNTLALRNEINPEESFDELFSRVKHTTLNAYAHQAYPFDKLVEELELKRDTSRSAVFDIMLVLHNNRKRVFDIESKEDQENRVSDNGSRTSKFDILIEVQEENDYLSFELEYNTDVYEKELIENFIVHYKTILSKLLADPTETISKIDYLSGEEKQKLLFTFNDTKVDYLGKTVMELFEAQVAKTPDKTALIFGENIMTYKELNERSNSLAYILREKYQVSKKTKVGVMLERSLESVISMIGVMKTGACYVPIDHDYPTERVAYILKDSALEIIVSSEDLCNKHNIKANSFVDIKKIDSEAREKNNPEATNHLDDGCYVIYTSGSTGNPKGVLQTHRMMSNLIQWDIHHSGITTGLRHLQYASFSFDASLHDLYFVLSSGGSAYIVQESSRLDYQSLKDEIIKKEIEVISMPFSALNAFCLETEIDSMEHHNIKHIVSTAEQLYVNDRLKKFLEKNVKVDLHNHYGPSETHVVTSYKMSSAWGNIENRASIGKPVSNSRIYILDSCYQLVPQGVEGELYIGGDNLAIGYLNKEDLTRERFIKDPFKEEELLYKTGDQGYWRPDGNIEFIGRKDDQVKIRGYRIELGEIECALLKYEAIKEAVVIVRENKHKEKELAAYITAKEPQNTFNLRSYLKTILPEYMLPTYYVQLEELPLTPNGKINKKSLPNPQDMDLASGVEYIAPRNKIEEKLVKIWKAVLQRESMGVKDDFFALGGHSLKAVRLSNEYQKEFEVKLSLNDLFAYSTIESHAELINSSKRSDFIQIEKVTLQVNYPISDAQRRLWVLSQIKESSVAYNISGSISLSQTIDIESFKKAIESTIERHEILRTVFKEDATGEIRQWILKREDLGFRIDYKDFRKEENKQEKVKSYIGEDTYKTFDLEKGPLLRASLLQVEDEAYVFYFNMHHIISDGWSMEILSKDVFSYYEAYKENREAALTELRIQYKDYSAWQLDQFKEESFKAHQAYWLENLAGELPLLDLPIRKPRPRLKTNNGHGLSTYIDQATSGKLKKYSQENGGSLFMGLLAAWNILMYRYTSQTDIIIGTPVAGREHADLNDQIGFYVNTLALRNKIDPEENLNSFYKRLKDNTLKSYSHQAYPFDRLVEKLNLQRDTSRSPVFDIMFTLLNTGEKTRRPDPLINRLNKGEFNLIEDMGYIPTTCDIDVTFLEVENYLYFKVVYNPDVYEREMIESLVNHYRQLLNALLENQEEKISRIDYLSETEKHELLVRFNDAKKNYPKEKTIVNLFEEQVAKTPDNIAVVFEEKVLTYKELNEQSNQLANYLQKNYAIKPDDLVGIKQERSEWMLISILGILKSGGAYVPIDPGYPQKRIDYIEKDSKCRLSIDENELIKFRKSQAAYSIEYTTSLTKSDNLAYIIYTSGSTGNPKGVLIEHRSIVNTLLSQIEFLQISSKNRGLQFASFSFDASVWETFLILLSGARLSIIKEHDRKDPKLVVDFIKTNKIDIATLPPSYLSKVSVNELKGLKTLITAGEQAVYEKAIEHLEWGKYYNAYGPTETSICGTIFKLENTSSLAFKSLPIGRPIANTQIYILSDYDRLQSIGVIGEICIGGMGLARGYLNREELTKEKFVVNPFKEGERLYKTGDLGRWLPDGNIEFIGRKDDQVKIRGFRIELGEIENALLKNKHIEEAAVLIKANNAEEQELVAYITSKTKLNSNDLKIHLQSMLPDYMLPAYYVQLESLPLTSNGKIDKKSLPNPQGLGIISGVEYVAPRNEIEEQVVKIWEEVLQRESIGIKDDFFVIGGHSLKAVRVISKIQKKFNVKFEVGKMFEENTVEKMAEFISIVSANTLNVDSEMDEFKI